MTRDQKIAMAREMAAKGHMWEEIGKALGVTGDTAHRWADEAFRRHRISGTNEARRQRNAGKARRGYHKVETSASAPPITRDMLPPPDTRDLSAVLCGDPLPGRSALDQRRQR